MFTVLITDTCRRVALSEAQALYVNGEIVSSISHAGFFLIFSYCFTIGLKKILILNVHAWSLLKRSGTQFKRWPICYDACQPKAGPTRNGITMAENDRFWTAAEQTQLRFSYPKMRKLFSMPVSKSSAKYYKCPKVQGLQGILTQEN